MSITDATPQGPEIILKVGAEGGVITLFGRKAVDGSWTFFAALIDHTPALLMGEDAGNPISCQTESVSAWENALALLDRQIPHWPRLFPIIVHLEFRDAILSAVRARVDSEDVDRWSGRIEAIDRMTQQRSHRLPPP